MTLLRRALSQIRPVEPDAPEPVEVPMVQIPRHIAEWALNMVSVGSDPKRDEVMTAIKQAIKIK